MARARDLALKILHRVEQQNAFAAALLARELKSVDQRESALATELVYGVLRRRSWLDHQLESAATKGLKKIDPITRQVLRIGAYQIIFLEKIPIHAAVSEAVTQIKRRNRSKMAGLVNAILRNLTRRDPKTLRPDPSPSNKSDPSVALGLGLPTWIYRAICDRFSPEKAHAMASGFNQTSRRTLRLNPSKVCRETLLTDDPQHTALGELSPWALDIDDSRRAARLVERGEGAYQDEGSQLAVLALDPKPDDQILDACAGRGGKTATLAIATGNRAEILAVDRQASKLERLAFELQQQGLRAHTLTSDFSDLSVFEGRGFDRVLLDAPCSGSGTLGRRPEIRWRLQKTDVAALARTQAQLLDASWRLVGARGRLVFSVCSLFAAEGIDHLTPFMERHPDCLLVDTPPDTWPKSVPWNGGRIVIDPTTGNTDGYQFLVFKKRAQSQFI